MALSFLFGGDTQETPDSIKRKRDLVRAIMGASSAPRNIGEGLNALGDGIVANVLDRRADAAEKTGTDAANSLFNSILGTPAGTPAGSAGGMPMPGAASELPQPTSATSTPPTDISGTEAYIREAAGKRGIDPDIAVKVARSEGLAPGVWQSNIVKDGKREPSYGPFQLYTGGGLGNKFQQVYGKSPADPSTVNQQIDFALDEAAKGGWSPWYGAAKVGVGSRDGLQNARALGYQPQQTGQQVASLDPSVGMASSGPIAPPPVNPAPPAPTPGYVDPKVVNVSRAPVQGPPRPAPELPPPTTIASAPQVAAQPPVAPQAPAAPPQQVAQNTQQPFAGVDPRLLQALSNPFLNQGQRAAVQMLIQQQQQANDPMAQLQLQEQQLKLKAMQNPSPEYEFITGKDGSVFRADKRAGNIESVYGGKPEQPTDVQEYEYAVKQLRDRGMPDDHIPDYSTWATTQKRAGASQVNIDQKAEGAFDKKLAEKQAEAFDAMATEGINARADLGVINELDGLLKGQGGTLSGLAGVAAKYGIGGEGVSDIQAANALINKLVPTQRAPGSGSMSDRDVEMFTRSLPSLWNSPGGNARILNVMRGLTQYKQQQGEIADQVLMGEMTRQEARRKLRELPNPLEEFRANENGTATDEKAAASPVPATGNAADLQAARDAIAKGAPRDKVIKRLQDAGIDPTGL